MNRGHKIIRIAACLLAVFSTARPIGAAELKPTPPLIAAPAECARWKVALRNTRGDAPTRPTVKEMIYTKTAATGCLEVVWSEGSKTESWLVDGYAAEQPVGNLHVKVTSPRDLRGGFGEGFLEFCKRFPGFDWLRLDLFKSVQNKDGRECFHYVNEDTDSEAWIDIKSNLPVARRVKDTAYSYLFLPAPNGSLEVPEKFLKALANYRKADL